MKNHVALDDLEIFQLSMDLGEIVWDWVGKWNELPQKTVGLQFVRATDSISANIEEGYGRYFFKERKQFCYYSRGSLMETKTWAKKAKTRNLITVEDFDRFMEKLQLLHLKLNVYIKKLKQEPPKSD